MNKLNIIKRVNEISRTLLNISKDKIKKDSDINNIRDLNKELSELNKALLVNLY